MRFILWAMGLSCLIALVSSKNGGTNVPDVSIVSSIPAAFGEFPYLCYLVLGNTLCAGSLIGPSHVLTAAHCLSGKSQTSVNTFTVRLNTLAQNGSTPGAISTGVKKFIIHEQFSSSTFDNDVALLVLNAPVTNVAVIALPPSTSNPATTKPSAMTTTQLSSATKRPATLTPPLCSCTCAPTTKLFKGRQTTKKPAIGASANNCATSNAIIFTWGTTSSDGSLSQVLLKTNVTIQDKSLCNNQYGSSSFGNMLCASAPSKDARQGDSGGPVIVDGFQMSLVSWGIGCFEQSLPGRVYTRVTPYVDWIQTTRANNPN